MYRDLREFIDAVDRVGELRRVEGADPELEIGAITEVAAGSTSCPMLLFDSIKGYATGYRVVTNLLHTPRRVALAVGLPTDLLGAAFVKAWKEKFRKPSYLPPIEVKDGAKSASPHLPLSTLRAFVKFLTPSSKIPSIHSLCHSPHIPQCSGLY